MDDSFRVRVDKAFGSLSSSSFSSLWTLTDEEIENKEWNKYLNRQYDDDDDDDKPVFFKFNAASSSSSSSSKQPPPLPREPSWSVSNFAKELDSDLQNLNGDKELVIRSSIGPNCTLDNEEEEDEYDKVAVGREKAGDRLYMRDVIHYDSVDINSYYELPDYFFGNHFPRDPRANHLAARLRLKEDAYAAGNFDSSDNNAQATFNLLADDDASSIPKPILTKRLTHPHPRSLKRVRFDPLLDPTQHAEGINFVAALPPPPPTNDDIPHPNLPDYLRNPSRYTRYTLNSSTDVDDESNRQAYMDFLNHLLKKKPTTTDEADIVDSSKPPTFITRKPSLVKREIELKQNQGDTSLDRTLQIDIAAGYAQDSELYTMDEDEPEIAINEKNVQKPGRQYRNRAVIDSEEQMT